MEAEAVEQGGDGCAGIRAGFREDAVVECGLRHLLLGGLADLGLEIYVGVHEQAGDAGIDLGLAIVDAGGEDLGGGQVHVNGIAIDGDVGRFELLEIDAGDDIAVGDKDEFVSDEKIRDVGAFALTFDDLVEGVDDRLEAGQLADLFDDGGGGCVDGGGAAGDEVGEAVEEAGVGEMAKRGDGDDAQQDAG